MARTWVLIAATLLLAAGAPATAAERPAGSRAAATTSAAETAAKKKVPARCRRLKGTKRSRCVAKAKRCRKGFVKRYNRRRTRARCVRRLGRPVAPKPPPALTPSVAPIDYTKIKGLS